MSNLLDHRLNRLIGLIEERLDLEHDPATIIADLEKTEGAKSPAFSGGAYHFTLAKVRTSCTSGERGLLHNWCSAARRRLEKEASQ